MKISIDEQLIALPKMGRPELEAIWVSLFARQPGPALRRSSLIRILAYRLQEKVYGSLKRSLANRLRAVIDEESEGKKTRSTTPIHLKPGTRIVREWQGQLHEVFTKPDGYEYNGRTWRSLSEIARAITGTRWSGPAFFGVGRHSSKRTAE